MARVRKGVSYVLGEATGSENHILPVNAMQYLPERQQLYTGGRDGVVKVWSANAGTPALEELPHSGEILLRPLPRQHPRHLFAASDHHSVHFDWINDVALVARGGALLTASSDLLVRLLRLGDREGDPAVSRLANVHTDYVKRVAALGADRAVSGGLDGLVAVWDLATLEPASRLGPAPSPAAGAGAGAGAPVLVYALAAHGNLVAAGGPSSTIAVYDVRSGSLVRRLVGHQDTVRCLAMDEGHIYLGLLDGSVKLWDTRTFLVLRNLECHDAAVWSLAREGQHLFLGDKAGHVVHTNLALLAEPEQGVCTLVARCLLPVVAVCPAEALLFVSTYTAVDRFHVPDTDALAAYQALRGEVAAPDLDLESFYDESVLSVEAQEHTLMFLSPRGGPLPDFVNAGEGQSGAPDDSTDQTPVEILLAPLPSLDITAIPFNTRPFQHFPIRPQLIVAKRMLNNKRHMLVLYLNGDMKIWDVFTCCEVKAFPHHSSVPLAGEDLKKRTREMDEIAQKHQTMDTLTSWCDVEIKLGKLLVSLYELSFNNVEMYYDELVAEYPFLLHLAPENRRVVKTQPDDRLPVAQILLNLIFHNYVMYEWGHRFSLETVDASCDDSIEAILATKTPLKVYTHNDEQHRPLIPLPRLPNLLIIVFETLPELGNLRDVYSFHLHDLADLDSPAKAHLVQLLRRTLPRWIGEPLLLDKFPTKEVPKIAFQLLETDYALLPPDKKIGGRVQRKIKRLPVLEGSVKLSLQNMLRVNKILLYLTERFELRTPEMKEKRVPSEWLVLECRGQPLDANMTLQTIKTKIWKLSADMELRFRRCFDE